MTGTTFSRVSSDYPGQQQRFARVRARLDAEDRAAKVIAEAVRTRVASFFVAGSLIAMVALEDERHRLLRRASRSIPRRRAGVRA